MSHSNSNAWVMVGFIVLLTACGAGTREDGVSSGTPIVADSENAKYVGTFSFEPVLGDNQLSMDLALPSGEPVVGARVAGDVRMLDHGHFSSQMPLCVEQGAGRYQMVNLVFDMAGEWNVDLEVEAEAGLDAFQLPVVVE